jgi:hypothetical protein
VQMPLAGLHAPTDEVQPPGGGVTHATGVPALQTPVLHVSRPLQRLPSVQVVPSVTFACVTTPVVLSQVSAVQGFPSSRVSPPARHVPLESHRSPVVQASPSVHGVLRGFAV